MSTEQTWRTKSTSSEATTRLGEAVGHKLRGGEAIELISDLGGGKTTFVRGLARGLGSRDKVTSPSFTLSNRYKAKGLTLYHFDFYRLAEPGIMRDELAEALEDPKSTVVVEWAHIVGRVLPADRLTINLCATGESSRELTFKYTDRLKYLVPQNLTS